MTLKNNQFRVYLPLTKNQQTKYNLNENGTLDIIGIASTTNQDLQKDIILPSAIESMKKQLLTSNRNLHGDHEYGLFTGLLGTINKVLDSDNNILKVGATILSKYAPEIKEMLDIGVNLGLSIGGAPTEYDRNKDGGWTIKNARLDEISLTGIPANMDTLGTVTTTKNGIVEGNCIAGVCNKIIKNMESNHMANEDNNKPDNIEDPQKQDTVDLKSEIQTIVDELWSEKEEGIIEKITNNVKSEIQDIVQEEVQNNEPAQDSGNDSNNDAPTDPVQKNIKPEDVQNMIQKSFHDFEEKFFKNLTETREPQSQVPVPPQPKPVKKTFSTEEAAEVLMRKQLTRNPLINAISNNL